MNEAIASILVIGGIVIIIASLGSMFGIAASACAVGVIMVTIGWRM